VPNRSCDDDGLQTQLVHEQVERHVPLLSPEFSAVQTCLKPHTLLPPLWLCPNVAAVPMPNPASENTCSAGIRHLRNPVCNDLAAAILEPLRIGHSSKRSILSRYTRATFHKGFLSHCRKLSVSSKELVRTLRHLLPSHQPYRIVCDHQHSVTSTVVQANGSHRVQ
jgi:hypothetical protein